MPAASGSSHQLDAAILLTLGMATAVGSALGFQYIGGYIPCALCYLQREPYYFGIPVAIAATAAAHFGMPSAITRILILIVVALMLLGAGLGVYHSGVEWGFWPGPESCSTPVNATPTDASTLLSDLNTIKGPSCTEAALRVFGLSFAGWNVIVSLILVSIGIWGVKKS